MAEKVTTMVIKADIQCPDCYKKIKKVLCKYPQIRDQVYDEKGNTVTVRVFYYDPERLRDKLYSRGGKVIQGIDIKEPAKPKEPEKQKVVVVDKPKETEKPKVVVVENKPKQPEKPKSDGGKPEKPDGGKPEDKPKSDGGKPEDKPKSDGGKPENKPKEAPKPKGPEPGPNPPPPEPVKLQAPVSGYPHPAMAYYEPAYGGYGGGTPYYGGYGVPPPPQPSYDGYQYGRGSNFNRVDSYFSEENPSSCSIM